MKMTTAVPSLRRLSPLDEHRKTLRGAEALEQGDDRDRNGRRDQRGEDEPLRRREGSVDPADLVDDRYEDRGRRDHGDDDAGDREGKHRGLVLEKAADLEMKRGFEEEAGEKDGVEELLRQRRRRDDARSAERQARDDQGDGVRELDPSRDQRDHGRDGEERDDRDLGRRPIIDETPRRLDRGP